MTQEDIINNSHEILKEFELLFINMDAELLKTEILDNFLTVENSNSVLLNYPTMFEQYQKLTQCLSKMFINWDDLRGCFPLGDYICHSELKNKLQKKDYNIQNFVLSRCGHDFSNHVKK